MCTVTYLPTAPGAFILTSNRDEAPHRSPLSLVREEGPAGETLLFPRDTGAGGTWITVSSRGRVLCVLNGAFGPHKRQPPYRRSRGLMVLDFFGYSRATDFFEQYTFQGMEPFTLIVYDAGELWEVRWDENELHRTRLQVELPYLWASATLYDPSAQTKRQRWFADWRAGQEPFEPGAIWQFHHQAGDGDPFNDLVMNRDNRVRTVSVTQIIQAGGTAEMRYHNLLEDTHAVAALIQQPGGVKP